MTVLSADKQAWIAQLSQVAQGNRSPDQALADLEQVWAHDPVASSEWSQVLHAATQYGFAPAVRWLLGQGVSCLPKKKGRISTREVAVDQVERAWRKSRTRDNTAKLPGEQRSISGLPALQEMLRALYLQPPVSVRELGALWSGLRTFSKASELVAEVLRTPDYAQWGGSEACEWVDRMLVFRPAPGFPDNSDWLKVISQHPPRGLGKDPAQVQRWLATLDGTHVPGKAQGPANWHLEQGKQAADRLRIKTWVDLFERLDIDWSAVQALRRKQAAPNLEALAVYWDCPALLQQIMAADALKPWPQRLGGSRGAWSALEGSEHVLEAVWRQLMHQAAKADRNVMDLPATHAAWWEIADALAAHPLHRAYLGKRREWSPAQAHALGWIANPTDLPEGGHHGAALDKARSTVFSGRLEKVLAAAEPVASARRRF